MYGKCSQLCLHPQDVQTFLQGYHQADRPNRCKMRLIFTFYTCLCYSLAKRFQILSANEWWMHPTLYILQHECDNGRLPGIVKVIQRKCANIPVKIHVELPNGRVCRTELDGWMCFWLYLSNATVRRTVLDDQICFWSDLSNEPTIW